MNTLNSVEGSCRCYDEKKNYTLKFPPYEKGQLTQFKTQKLLIPFRSPSNPEPGTATRNVTRNFRAILRGP